MAEINPNLLLQIPQRNDLSSTFNNILANIGQVDRIKQNRQQAPIMQQNFERESRGADQDAKRKSLVLGAARIAPMLNSGDFSGARSELVNRITDLERQGVSSEESKQALVELNTNPEIFTQRVNQVVNFGRQSGILNNQNQATTAQKNRSSLIKDLEGAIDPATKRLIPVEQMSAIQKNAAIGLQLVAPVRDTAQERAANNSGLGSRIADFEGNVSGAKESGKLKSQLKFAPQIARDIAKAKQEVKQRGDIFTELNQMQAALPGLKDVVSKLKVLSGDATFTLGGRVFDEAAKQVFGVATKGATSRDKMISLVNNQILPLLRPIFGSQFTEREGDRLISAFADVNSTPESRRGQLDSFLSQMERNIEAKSKELEGLDRQNQPQVFNFDAQGNLIQ